LEIDVWIVVTRSFFNHCYLGEVTAILAVIQLWQGNATQVFPTAWIAPYVLFLMTLHDFF
jgi:hypothetical protein